MDDEKNTTDLTGLASYGRAAEALVEGARAFLGRICNPGAEEFGLLIRDQVSASRQRNLVAIANKAKTKVPAINPI